MTKEITIQGLKTGDKDFCKNGKVTVQFTQDNIGETLSLTYNDEIQICVPFEDIRNLVGVK